VHFAADIKIAHSIFALPFAASSFFVGSIPAPTFRQCLLLVICMVLARSTAMGMNRFLDRHIDLSNPRTRARKIPSGQMTAFQSLFWSLVAAVFFVVSASSLSPLAGYLSIPLLIILVAYSWMKRLTWATHWYLGFCLGLAPMAIQVAMSGTLSLPIVLLGTAVMFWTGGFDILYSLQDLDFDKKLGLYSVPSKFGPAGAIWLSRVSFGIMIGLLTAIGEISNRGALYFAGILVISVILIVEHWLVRDAKKTGKSALIGVAFFNINAWVSVVFFAFVALDYWIYS
jgi:4-hydroxybenzoate polyprenyltransferase